jgi:hypothetical protein
LVSQTIVPFAQNGKWGFKQKENVIIKPQYDTVFAFDKTNKIALVGAKNKINTIVNPLTGEETETVDYFYITPNNTKIKLLAENFPDSVFTFGEQQELLSNYLDSTNYFKILFQKKIYLFSKYGKQLSLGYDNITKAKASNFFETENYSENNHAIIRTKGLVDTAGLVIVNCKYKDVTFNRDDSIIYCCSAVFNTKLNDDVYNYKGKLIYSSKKHIEFASKKCYVLKSYSPNETYFIENTQTKETVEFEGDDFFYLQNNKGLFIIKDNWFLMDLNTTKKQKVNKESYFFNVFNLLKS